MKVERPRMTMMMMTIPLILHLHSLPMVRRLWAELAFEWMMMLMMTMAMLMLMDDADDDDDADDNVDDGTNDTIALFANGATTVDRAWSRNTEQNKHHDNKNSKYSMIQFPIATTTTTTTTGSTATTTRTLVVLPPPTATYHDSRYRWYLFECRRL
jgi:hypothetical protein